LPYNKQVANKQVAGQVDSQVAGQDDRAEKLLECCNMPKTRREMQEFVGMASREHFNKAILLLLLESRKLIITFPDKPNSRKQKYVRA
jgi:ATP-dependent DNA helicase RecG